MTSTPMKQRFSCTEQKNSHLPPSSGLAFFGGKHGLEKCLLLLWRGVVTCLQRSPRYQDGPMHPGGCVVNPPAKDAHPLCAISTRWTKPPSSVSSSREKTSLHGRHSAGEDRGSNGRFRGGGPLSSRRGSLPAAAFSVHHDHASANKRPLHRWSPRTDRMQDESLTSRGQTVGDSGGGTA